MTKFKKSKRKILKDNKNYNDVMGRNNQKFEHFTRKIFTMDARSL